MSKILTEQTKNKNSYSIRIQPYRLLIYIPMGAFLVFIGLGFFTGVSTYDSSRYPFFIEKLMGPILLTLGLYLSVFPIFLYVSQENIDFNEESITFNTYFKGRKTILHEDVLGFYTDKGDCLYIQTKNDRYRINTMATNKSSSQLLYMIQKRYSWYKDLQYIYFVEYNSNKIQ